jgi:RimJ/RimL family protein N-acetyltransferase
MRFPEEVPNLSDGVVTLRAHRASDVAAIVEACADPESARWTTVPTPYGRANAERFLGAVVADGWRFETSYCWAIEATHDTGQPRFAGNIDLRVEGTAPGDIGFLLHPWARGCGLMTRAVRLVVEWAFADRGMSVVHWSAHVGNWASRRVAWACGFTIEGTVRQLLPQRGELRDGWVGSRLVTDSGAPVTRWLEAPVIRGERVVLRELRESDADRVVEACRDERTRHWLATLPSPYTYQHALHYVRGRQELQAGGAGVWWCVADPVTDQLLANISVMDLDGEDPTSGEVGYWTHPDARGRGVMTEALQLLVPESFSAAGLALRRLSLFAAEDNAASRRVAELAGFRQVGLHRAAEPIGDGTYANLAAYDLLAAEAGH